MALRRDREGTLGDHLESHMRSDDAQGRIGRGRLPGQMEKPGIARHPFVRRLRLAPGGRVGVVFGISGGFGHAEQLRGNDPLCSLFPRRAEPRLEPYSE